METVERLSQINPTQWDLVQKIEQHVAKVATFDMVGHDIWHVRRVWSLAQYIGDREGGDPYVLALASLLHDLDDWKFQKQGVKSNQAKSLMQDLSLGTTVVDQVVAIIEQVSFKGGFGKVPASLEAKIVQDADRLDAIGAVGIARVFAYGGMVKQPLYDPAQPVIEYQSADEYQNKKTSSVNHFYEKLLKIKGMMNTETAKELAGKRHQLMQDYLSEFFDEWHFNQAPLKKSGL